MSSQTAWSGTIRRRAAEAASRRTEAEEQEQEGRRSRPGSCGTGAHVGDAGLVGRAPDWRGGSEPLAPWWRQACFTAAPICAEEQAMLSPMRAITVRAIPLAAYPARFLDRRSGGLLASPHAATHSDHGRADATRPHAQVRSRRPSWASKRRTLSPDPGPGVGPSVRVVGST